MSSRSLPPNSHQNWNSRSQYESSREDGYGRDYGPTRTRYFIPGSLHHQPEERGGTHVSWRLVEERVTTGPFGLTRGGLSTRSIYQLFLQDTVSRTDNFNGSFPSQPHSPAQILDLVRGTQERVSPHPILSIRDSPPTIRSDWNLPFPPWATVDHGLSDAEFNKAMKQLRKEVYNPKYSRQKSLMQNKGSFKGNVNINIIDSKAEEEAVKNEGKSCTICLENFKLNEEVLVTPCNHMFHGDCLVPWVKSHGKCPVCRYVFYENDNNNNDRVIGVSNNNNGRLSRVNNNSNNNGRVSGVSNNNHNNNGRVRVPSNNNGLVNRVTNSSIDLSSYIVAMQEALNWVNRDSLAAQP